MTTLLIGILIPLLKALLGFATLGISCYKHYVLHEPFMFEQIETAK